MCCVLCYNYSSRLVVHASLAILTELSLGFFVEELLCIERGASTASTCYGGTANSDVHCFKLSCLYFGKKTSFEEQVLTISET